MPEPATATASSAEETTERLSRSVNAILKPGQSTTVFVGERPATFRILLSGTAGPTHETRSPRDDRCIRRRLLQRRHGWPPN